MLSDFRIKPVVFLLSLVVSFSLSAQTTPKLLFDPYPFEEIFSGNLEPVSTLGDVGLTAHFNSSSRNFDSPAFVLAGAFPFNSKAGPRGAGWAWGVAAGLHEFNQEASHTFTAGSYFWELSMGRAILRQEDYPDAGVRGYFEVAFRNERPKLLSGYSNFLNESHRPVEDQSTTLIFRAGASMDSEGQGFVRQVPGRFTPAFDFALHLPLVSQHSVLLTGQVRLPFHCGLRWLRCSPFLRVTHSRLVIREDVFEDVQSKITAGSQFIFLIEPRYQFSLQVSWQGYVAGLDPDTKKRQSAFVATPYIRTSFSIGF